MYTKQVHRCWRRMHRVQHAEEAICDGNLWRSVRSESVFDIVFKQLHVHVIQTGFAYKQRLVNGEKIA